MPETPSDGSPPRRQSGDERIDVAFHRIWSAVSVIQGRAQMWQRRLRRADEPDRDQLLQTFATIEQSCRTIAQHLRRVEGTKHDHDDA